MVEGTPSDLHALKAGTGCGTEQPDSHTIPSNETCSGLFSEQGLCIAIHPIRGINFEEAIGNDRALDR